ncbi:Random slug protein 5, partial [Mucuna pruriens]
MEIVKKDLIVDNNNPENLSSEKGKERPRALEVVKRDLMMNNNLSKTNMSADPKKTASNGEKMLTSQEQQALINEVRRLIGPQSGKASIFCSDAYLRARNWNVKKAVKMLKLTLKWREEYKPEEIRWEDVAHEAETGKIYRSSYIDKHGRTVLVMRPSHQNSKSTKGQIKYLVYCMENAILNLPPEQEQMVWLIDFQGFNMSHISIKVTRETAHVLQEHYPERLGLAILYNAPKFFEPFFMMVKPLLEPKTYNKVKFGYSDDQNTKKIMVDLFDFDHLESAFGGNDDTGFDINRYAERMKEDDKKIPSFWTRENSPSSVPNHAPLDSARLDSDSDASDIEKIDSSPDPVDTGIINPDQNILVHLTRYLNSNNGTRRKRDNIYNV